MYKSVKLFTFIVKDSLVYKLVFTLLRQGEHTEWRQPSSLGVSAGRLQQGQRLSRSQGEPGTSGSTPDITARAHRQRLVLQTIHRFHNRLSPY